MSIPLRNSVSSLFLCSLALLFLTPLSRAGDDWLPVTPEELKMASEPKAPGAPAIYLFRQVDRNDQENRERNYARVKILTEEGRKYADVEIPFFKERGNIRGIQARTIRPDGSIVNFDGKVYEKTIVKAKGVKYLAKTFSMPDAQVGSIIEYRYVQDMEEGWVYDSRWILSEELFTKHAKFTLKPNPRFSLRWSWPTGLPEGTTPPKEEPDRMIHLETSNVPAFQIEDYMPPENELKFRVDFIYSSELTSEKDQERFWKKEGKQRFGGINSFVDKRKAMEQAVSQIVSPTDTPEVKLQKIYARAQQVRNFSFEQEKTAQELKREKLKNINNVEDVFQRGYGEGWQITWLFLALARAAGFQADPVLVSTRNLYFFKRNLMNPRELNTNVVVVTLNGKDLYLDPGTAFAPFGLLPWSETGVQGLRLDKEGGAWVITTMPLPSESRIQRQATLHLTDTGSLEGKVTLTFTGLEALRRRLEERNADDTEKNKFLEDQLEEYIPVASEAKLTNRPEWNSSSSALVAEYDLKVPGWASAAGRRTLLPASLFGAGEKHVFEHAARHYPIYFDFPYQDDDDVSIDLPLGWQIGSMPKPQDANAKVCVYHLTADNNNGTLHLKRNIVIDLSLVDIKYYASLRNFFQFVRTGDEEQIVLSPNAASAQNAQN